MSQPAYLADFGVADTSRVRGAGFASSKGQRITHDPFERLALGDPEIDSVVRRLRRAARSDLPIVLHGETGTGKELFARAIHDASPRQRGRFVAVNCASIPEGLIESELFGHRPGAFTGASARGSKGLIQQADGGTLFLDEIGDMPLGLQTRLLRVLAEREITPVGSDVPSKVDFRVVSATHRDLGARVADGTFREDLMFRLQGLAVTLPALRLRSDIVELAERLLGDESARLGHTPALGSCAMEFIRHFSWAGNVRQLKQVLATSAWLSDGPVITCDDLRSVVCVAGPERVEVVPEAEVLLDSLRTEAMTERAALLLSLKRNRWNVSRTASEFNTARTTIYRRMNKFGIVQPNFADQAPTSATRGLGFQQ